MITPRETFRKAHGKDWGQVVDTSLFEAGATAALAQMQLGTSQELFQEAAAQAHFRMQGAKEFLAILMTLHADQSEPTRLRTTKNLTQPD